MRISGRIYGFLTGPDHPSLFCPFSCWVRLCWLHEASFRRKDGFCEWISHVASTGEPEYREDPLDVPLRTPNVREHAS